MAFVLSVTLMGCSFSVNGPPKGWTPDQGGPPRCDLSAASAKVADGLAGSVLLGFGALVFSSQEDSESSIIAFLFGVTSLPFWLAIHGASRKTNACRATHEQYNDWLAAGRPSAQERMSERRAVLDEEQRRRDEKVAQDRLRYQLPDRFTDEQTLRFARQARAAAISGDCAVLGTLLATIKLRDVAYHDALVRSTALDGCRR